MFIHTDEVKDDNRKKTLKMPGTDIDVRFMKYADALFVNMEDYFKTLTNKTDVFIFKSIVPKKWTDYNKVWMNVDKFNEVYNKISKDPIKEK
jgi:hypothetical protein